MPAFKTSFATLVVLALGLGQTLARPAAPVDDAHLPRKSSTSQILTSPPLAASHLFCRVVDAEPVQRREAARAKRALRSVERAFEDTNTLVERQDGTFTAAAIAAFSAYTRTACTTNDQCLNAPSQVRAIFKDFQHEKLTVHGLTQL